MKPELRFVEFYPHPIASVWNAISTADALAVWLMPNDFEPAIGHRFSFRINPGPERSARIQCQVLELSPPSRIVWSWQASEDSPTGEVTIELKDVAGGTELTLVHREADPARRSRYASGWPGKFAALRDLLLSAR